MKPSGQSNKANASNIKTKKNSKDREKRKSQGGTIEVNNHNSTEKGSPTKESRLYAGIDADSLFNYAEQATVEHLSEDITNVVTEDINYRLRYIINDSLIKARLSGRNAIDSNDIEQTFENLRIEKVYGAPSQPSWIPFGDQTLSCLDDRVVNLVEIAEEENVYHQYLETVVTTTWIPEKEISRPLTNYFSTMCQMIVNNDIAVRRTALINISENSRIGPIIEWFYNFGYILLSKDITYDSLTLRALDLITVLENSRTCRINVSEKQLKLLVRLILQRLLKSTTTNEVLKPICNTLALLCIREPLKQFVIAKILQKMDEAFENYALAIITTANSLGVDAIQSIILPNLHLFLSKAVDKVEPSFSYSILESYYILCKETSIDSNIYESFYEYLSDAITIFNEPSNTNGRTRQKDLNFTHVKCDLLKTRRKVFSKQKTNVIPIEEVFEMPSENSLLRKKMQEHRWDFNPNTETCVVIGKTSLLLPVFKRKQRVYTKCEDHSLVAYNF